MASSLRFKHLPLSTILSCTTPSNTTLTTNTRRSHRFITTTTISSTRHAVRSIMAACHRWATLYRPAQQLPRYHHTHYPSTVGGPPNSAQLIARGPGGGMQSPTTTLQMTLASLAAMQTYGGYAAASSVPSFAHPSPMMSPIMSQSTGPPVATPDAKAILAERFKTKLCQNYERHGHCPYESRCMFAHGDHDLRTKEMNLVDNLVTEEAIKNYRKSVLPYNKPSDTDGSPIVRSVHRGSGYKSCTTTGGEHPSNSRESAFRADASPISTAADGCGEPIIRHGESMAQQQHHQRHQQVPPYSTTLSSTELLAQTEGVTDPAVRRKKPVSEVRKAYLKAKKKRKLRRRALRRQEEALAQRGEGVEPREGADDDSSTGSEDGENDDAHGDGTSSRSSDLVVHAARRGSAASGRVTAQGRPLSRAGSEYAVMPSAADDAPVVAYDDKFVSVEAVIFTPDASPSALIPLDLTARGGEPSAVDYLRILGYPSLNSTGGGGLQQQPQPDQYATAHFHHHHGNGGGDPLNLSSSGMGNPAGGAHGVTPYQHDPYNRVPLMHTSAANSASNVNTSGLHTTSTSQTPTATPDTAGSSSIGFHMRSLYNTADVTPSGVAAAENNNPFMNASVDDPLAAVPDNPDAGMLPPPRVDPVSRDSHMAATRRGSGQQLAYYDFYLPAQERDSPAIPMHRASPHSQACRTPQRDGGVVYPPPGLGPSMSLPAPYMSGGSGGQTHPADGYYFSTTSPEYEFGAGFRRQTPPTTPPPMVSQYEYDPNFRGFHTPYGSGSGAVHQQQPQGYPQQFQHPHHQGHYGQQPQQQQQLYQQQRRGSSQAGVGPGRHLSSPLDGGSGFVDDGGCASLQGSFGPSAANHNGNSRHPSLSQAHPSQHMGVRGVLTPTRYGSAPSTYEPTGTHGMHAGQFEHVPDPPLDLQGYVFPTQRRASQTFQDPMNASYRSTG
jgi:hypothetical protein